VVVADNAEAVPTAALGVGTLEEELATQISAKPNYCRNEPVPNRSQGFGGEGAIVFSAHESRLYGVRSFNRSDREFQKGPGSAPVA
jgi:hypothetical protein